MTPRPTAAAATARRVAVAVRGSEGVKFEPEIRRAFVVVLVYRSYRRNVTAYLKAAVSVAVQ